GRRALALPDHQPAAALDRGNRRAPLQTGRRGVDEELAAPGRSIFVEQPGVDALRVAVGGFPGDQEVARRVAGDRGIAAQARADPDLGADGLALLRPEGATEDAGTRLPDHDRIQAAAAHQDLGLALVAVGDGVEADRRALRRARGGEHLRENVAVDDLPALEEEVGADVVPLL